METRRIRIPVEDFALEGEWRAPASPAGPCVVVCHPHPQYGGDMDNNVVVAAVRGLTAVGLGALTFNFRGVGASGGRYGGGAGEREDARCAAAQPDAAPARIGLAGYSFGAGVAAAVAGDVDAPALALISPALRDDTLLTHLAPLAIPVLVIAGAEDRACVPEHLQALTALPHVEVHAVPGVDHFWWGAEALVADAMGAFFARHLGA